MGAGGSPRLRRDCRRRSTWFPRRPNIPMVLLILTITAILPIILIGPPSLGFSGSGPLSWWRGDFRISTMASATVLTAALPTVFMVASATVFMVASATVFTVASPTVFTLASPTVFTVASATGSPLDTGAAQAVGIASRAAALYRG